MSVWYQYTSGSSSRYVNHSTIKRYDSDLDPTPLDFVIRLVAEHLETDEIHLPELHRSLDGDLIDRFLRRPPAAGELWFRWDVVRVTLSADRTVEVSSIGGEGDTLPSNEDRAESTRSHNRARYEIQVTTE